MPSTACSSRSPGSGAASSPVMSPTLPHARAPAGHPSPIVRSRSPVRGHGIASAPLARLLGSGARARHNRRVATGRCSRRRDAPTAGPPTRAAGRGGTAVGESDRRLGGVPGPSVRAPRPTLVRFLETMPAAFCFLDTAVALPVRQRRGRAADGPPPRRGRSASRCGRRSPASSGSVVEADLPRRPPATGRPMTFETPHRSAPDRWVEARVWPGPDGLALYVLDATDRRDAEETARRADARAALLGPGQRGADRRAGHRVGARPAGPAGRARR